MLQDLVVNAIAIHQGSIAAAEIVQDPLAIPEHESGVPARHLCVYKAYGILPAAAYGGLLLKGIQSPLQETPGMFQ
jgi:hypothetical protein